GDGDDTVLPTRGRLQSVPTEVGLPFGNPAYYKIQYLHSVYWPVYRDFIMNLRAYVGWGDGYDGLPFPFFKAFFAGGVNTVRGYQTASLGPRDVYGNSLGSRLKLVGNAELFYPLLKGEKWVRARLFFDAGAILAKDGRPCVW